MKFRSRRRTPPEINLTSLIDVVFLLLLFFMVSATFEKLGRMQVELPQAEPNVEQDQPPDRITVTVDAEGQFFVNERELVNADVETVKRALASVAGERRDLPLVISADGRAPHQAVVTVMDAASQIGVARVSFAIKRNEPTPSP
jgi:biopolymer transport protein ExbD